jgi:Lon protease-like protein
MVDVLPAITEALPIFPLPGAVLMPGELLPLHVFEPRYRALVAACLAESQHFAVATLQPGYERDYQGRPAVFPEIGIGRIVRHQPLPDGRANILVSFVAAARVESELPSLEPFRRVRWVPVAEPPAASYPPLGGLRVLAGQVLARLEGAPELEPLFALEGPAWLDTMARAVLAVPRERREYLVAATGQQRAALVHEALVALLEESGDGVEA